MDIEALNEVNCNFYQKFLSGSTYVAVDSVPIGITGSTAVNIENIYLPEKFWHKLWIKNN